MSVKVPCAAAGVCQSNFATNAELQEERPFLKCKRMEEWLFYQPLPTAGIFKNGPRIYCPAAGIGTNIAALIGRRSTAKLLRLP